MLAKFMTWMAVDFEYFMFFLAAIIALLHKLARRQMNMSEIIFRWFVLLPLGFVGLYSAMRHGVYSPEVAAKIGWLGGLFQFKVATANLGFGLIAALSFNASFGFRLAAVLGNTCWLWGDAITRFTKYYFSFNNAASGFWLDIFLPIVLLLCLISIKRQQKDY